MREGGLVEKIGPHATGRPFFASVAVCEPEAYARLSLGLPAEALPLVFQPALAEGRMGWYLQPETFGIWKDVGTPALWWDTHLEMIERMETGALPQSWRLMIEKKIERVQSGVWQGRESQSRIKKAWPVSFWDGQGIAPQDLGPQQILYGSAQNLTGRGIGFGGSWVEIVDL
jgi:hypothetical protein